MTIRLSRTFAVLGGTIWLALLFQGCSGQTHPVGEPPVLDVAGQACDDAGSQQKALQCPPCPMPAATTMDAGAVATAIPCNVHADCYAINGFCDRGACVASPTALPCTVDADCDSRFCNRGLCAALRTGNLPNGSPCRADDHCQSGLCDRGVCTDIGGMRNANHGITCRPIPPFAERRGRRFEVPCDPYICLDGRCRSCNSDAECTYWYGGGTCAHDPGLPGESCGDHRPLDPDAPYKTPPPQPPGIVPPDAGAGARQFAPGALPPGLAPSAARPLSAPHP